MGSLSNHSPKETRTQVLSRGSLTIIGCLFLTSTLAATSCGDTNDTGEKKQGLEATQAEAGAKEKESNAATSDPSAFFLETVKPAFEKDCASCHSTQPKTLPAGPLTIFSSVSMLRQLDSTDPAAFSLIKKVKGILTHGGGNRCEGDAPACKAILEWHELAVKAGAVIQAATTSSSPDPTGKPGTSTGTGTGSNYTGSGEVTSISPLGEVLGFAVNPENPSEVVQFEVYINGTNTTGTLIAKGPAQSPGYDRDIPGDHRFSAQIPESYRNGVRRTLSIYSVSSKGTNLINPGQTEFVGYRQTPEGKAFWESNVKNLLQCAGCHAGSLTYETTFGWLMTPGKHMGATARNNKMLNNPGTANGEGHGGGNRCNNNIDTGLCKELQQWWTIEFGSL